jgi:transcriptional regulator with XRE-family HTH domain
MRLGVKARTHRRRDYYEDVPKIKSLRQILGENAKAIRADKKLSQPKVVAAAKKAGGQIDQTTVGRVERCVHPATVDIIEALAKGLGIPSWQLLIPDGADEKFLAILHAWSQATPGGRELLSIAADGALRREEDADHERPAVATPKRHRAGNH